MFNLIMRHYDWTDTSATMDLSRMFENTDTFITEQFSEGGLPTLERLRRLPCLFIPEGTDDEICRVGTLTNVRLRNQDEVYFEYMLDSDVPPIRNSSLFQQRIKLDMNRSRNNFDWHRNHWAVKDVDLYRFLLRSVNPRRQRPSVFNITEHEDIQPQLMSVMMPFDAGFIQVYNSIQQAGLACNLVTRRADEIWEAPGIIQDVVSLIDRARVVICDLSNRNPNVFYEAGIAHTLGREVIIITQSEHDVPFDLRHIRHIRYLNNTEGLDRLKRDLEARLNTIIGH